MTTPEAAEEWRHSIVQLRRGFSAANRVEVSRGRIASPGHRPVERPAFTLVVPVREGAAVLAQALSSLQQQDLWDWECIVVDDAAADYALDVALLFAESDGRFRIASHGTTRGAAAASNTGLRLARGDCVIFLTVATMLFPGVLTAHRAATAAGAATGSYCDWRTIAPDAVPRLPQSHPRPPDKVPNLAAALDAGCPDAAIAVRRADVIRAGGLDESSPEPFARLWARLKRSGTFAYAPTIGVGRRKRNRPPLPQPSVGGGDVRPRAATEEDDSVRVLQPNLRVVTADAAGHELKDAVLLVPQVRYHVDELGPLADELRRRGNRIGFMPTSVQGRLGQALRRQVLNELSKYTDTVVDWDPKLPRQCRLAGVVVLNDWGSTKQLVTEAKVEGVPTFAKVEGVQDFFDCDTGRSRQPYRNADVVLAQGPNDRRALADRNVHVVGSARLEQVLNGPRSMRQRLVAVNLNFTYDVLVNEANEWLAGVVNACRNAAVDYVICPHPAQYPDHIDRTLLAGHMASEPLRAVLLRAGLVITRFSTVLFEAIARGVPVVYHNPHGERAWHGQMPTAPALPITESAADLERRLPDLLDDPADPLTRFHRVFAAQINVRGDRPSAVRAADVIVGRLQ